MKMRSVRLLGLVLMGCTLAAAPAPTAVPGGGGGRGARGAGRAAPPSGPPEGIERVKLWSGTPSGGIVQGNDRDADPTEPTMDIYLPPSEKASGAAVVVLPGGGYVNLSMTNEGSSIAKMLVSHDIAAFVVRYRHGPRYHYPAPQIDGQRALRTVRSKAAEYHLQPDRIGVLGFSAGGHLAASLATLDIPAPEHPDEIDKLSARPDFAVLMYPVINLTDDAVTHKGSRTALTQEDPALFAQLSPEQHVSKETPPVFIVQGMDDRTVPVMNSVLFYEACLKNKVPAEMHLFENGRHGFGLGGNDPSLSSWPDLMVKWMAHNKWLAAPAAAGNAAH